MVEELVDSAKRIVMGLRQAEELAKQGRIEEAKSAYRELKKEAMEKKLYRGLAALFRKAEKAIFHRGATSAKTKA